MPDNNQDHSNQKVAEINFLHSKLEELEKKLLKYGDLEQMVEESEQRFKQILSLTYDGIVIYEKDSGKILEANLRLVHKLQYTLKDVIGQSVLEFIIPEQRKTIGTRLSENLPDIYEATLIDKKGKQLEFEICSRSCLYEGRRVKMAAVSDISYRKQYERTLRESEEKFRSLTENTNDSIILTEKGQIIYANPSTTFVLGTGIDTLPKLTDILKNIHPNDKQCVHSLIDRIMMGQRQIQACQYRIVTPEKHERWIWSRVFPVVPNDPDDSRLVLLSSDITEMREREDAQKRMEIAARTAEEKYKVLTSLLPEIILETDLDGNLTFVNLKAIDVFEYGSDFYIQNLRFIELITKEDRNRCKEYFKKIIAGEIIPESEYTAITKSGRKFPVTIHATRMYANNELTGVSIVMFDITKEKFAERRALNYQENMLFLSNSALKFLTFSNDDDIFIFIGKSLSKIVPKSVVVVFSYDQSNNTSYIRFISGIYSYVEQIVKILGKSPEEFSIVLPQGFKNKYLSHKTLMRLDSLEDATGTGWPVEPVNMIQKMLHVNNFYSMGMSREGKLYGGILIATKREADTVDSQLIETFVYQAGIALHRKQVENELVKAKLIAEESDRLKSAFLANMSHEVRTPLNGILGLAQLLLKSDIAPEMHNDYVKMIVESGSSLLTLIEDIMDVSKIEAKQMKIKYKPFHLNTLMDQLYSIFLAHPLFQQKNANDQQNLELRCIKPEENIFLISDPDRLQQIFVNLIGNALKFTQRGFVEFGYEVKKKQILFYVKDSGIGIPKDKTEKIFERFTQVDNTLARKFGGSGLGLAISKGLVNLLNGNIWCESNLGEGSSFYFNVPYHPTTLTSNSASPSKTGLTDHNWNDYTVLIVEDDKINFRVMEAMLRNTKINIIHADNGRKAIDCIRANPQIDLVLMDVHLPELSGLEATRIILNINPHIPIIAQTANAMSDDKDKCIEAGCVDYISKPIDMGTLFSKISKYLPIKDYDN